MSKRVSLLSGRFERHGGPDASSAKLAPSPILREYETLPVAKTSSLCHISLAIRGANSKYMNYFRSLMNISRTDQGFVRKLSLTTRFQISVLTSMLLICLKTF